MSRPRIVAGNWKMNHGSVGARAYGEAFAPPPVSPDLQVVLFPPALAFSALRDALISRGLHHVVLGVQNIHWEAAGAFTGENSADAVTEAGAGWVLAGHSERRHVFGETHEEVAWKVRAALQAGLVPLVCVGESREERRAGRLEAVLEAQLRPVLDALAGATGSHGGEHPRPGSFHVAYEPVWAIGTGDTATPDDAQNAHLLIRRLLGEAFPAEVAQGTSVLYGGSVTPANAAGLLAPPDVDGLLVGGASLDPHRFSEICGSGIRADGTQP